MCGIAGFIGSQKYFPTEKKINNCKRSLIRRGPDGNGVYKNFDKNKKVLFIHTRLSIIDPSKNSNQPFSDESGTLIFNGMIYNYLELKKKLKKKGIKFKTNSDTEVLLKLLNVHKEQSLKYLDGMWSFAYYNFKDNNIIISRDRLGEKPLFLKWNKSNLYFSNSIKALYELDKEKLVFNNKKVKDCLRYPDKSLGLDNSTLFKKINEFKKAHFLKINLSNNKFVYKRYWKLKVLQKRIAFNKACFELKRRIKKIVATRSRSDVKNCMLISGGLDSNTIATFIKNKKKTLGYSLSSSSPEYDEKKLIEISSKKNNFPTTFVKSRNKNSLKTLFSIIKNSYNILPTTTSLGLALVCDQIKRDKNKVLLTGIGGDELFAGYYVNFIAHLLSIKKNKKKFNMKHDFWNQNVKIFIRNKFLKELNDPMITKYKYNLNSYIDLSLNKYFKKNRKMRIKKVSKDIFYNNMLQNIFYLSIPTQNYQNDLISMHYSLESRSPFLSHDLMSYTYSLNKDYFMFNGVPKSLLRNSMSKHLPKKICNNFEKIGFYSPFNSFFSIKDMKKIKKYIFHSKILKKILKFKMLKKLISKKEINISHQESKFLFACLNLVIIEKTIQNTGRY